MSRTRAVRLFNLAIPAGGEPISALEAVGFPTTFRITMAAIDPTSVPETKGQANGVPHFLGSTLKIIRVPEDDDDDEDSDDDESMDLADMLDGGSDSDEDGDNEGPSDPSKSPKAKRMAALKEALANGDNDMEIEGERPLTAKAKGKGKAAAQDSDSNDDDEDEDEDDFDDEIETPEEFVLCTLDPSKSYQQPLDITVNEYENVYFSSNGTHDIYLSGNVLLGEDDEHDHGDMYDEDDEDDYDLPPDEDELDYEDEEDESDELDDMEDPRITEVMSEDEGEAAPQLIKAAPEPAAVKGKGKNKRARDESEIETPEKVSTDSILNKSLKTAEVGAEEEQKLSKSQLKKQRKKMKDNAGNAVETTVSGEEDKGVKHDVTPKSDKKVQFAKTLVQGPSGAVQPNGDVAKAKTETKVIEAPKVNGDAAKPASAKGPRVVQGVTIDDRKTGSGPAAKKGDKVSMRYIGKLEKDKKVFDANKKGPPFTFKLGAGQVIKGWDIGIQGMTVGGERRISVPAQLAYGSRSMPDIPANSTLIFDVKCLEIK